MLENLKVALKKQKKLIIIFFLTIFLPSLSLSIFGIRAIKNERFRLAKQAESGLRRAAGFLKTQINSRFQDIDLTLQNLAEHPSFQEKNYPAIKALLESQLAPNLLVDQIFLVYKNEEPQFPLFQKALKSKISISAALLNGAQIEKLKKAEDCEFRQKKYRSAISLYNELFFQTKDKNGQAQMLNNIGRCYAKLKNYQQAIQYYSKIGDRYPDSTTSLGLPLSLIARLQILDCYNNLGDFNNCLKGSLALYRDIFQGLWGLTENQFKTYSSLVEEVVKSNLSKKAGDSVAVNYQNEFEQLKKKHKEMIKQYQIIAILEKEIIPELYKKILESKTHKAQIFRHSQTIDERIFLISAAGIPDKSEENSHGILGVKIKNEALEKEILKTIIADVPSSENISLSVSDLSGRTLFGNKDSSPDRVGATEFFDDNFPPWRLELFHSKPESLSILDIRKSFYFWTILTLIVILTFGAVIMVRAVAHEMEILKIKSDFVSAVSHEFKTPLTSIKALIERLKEGKVKDSAKMEQYFSLISQDAERLTRLVRNILDFSKIEEGKKEYEFSKTDIGQIILQQIDNFRKDETQKKIKIHTTIPENIPRLYADEDALAQAFNNLIDNALKFSPEGKEIYIHLKAEKENVIVEFIDQGAGIPQDELNKIFDKFYQGRNALRQSVKGAGLGLTLAKHIVEAHGGRISVKSKLGQGSTFSLIFPINKDK